jgi:hypothetical protein
VQIGYFGDSYDIVKQSLLRWLVRYNLAISFDIEAGGYSAKLDSGDIPKARAGNDDGPPAKGRRRLAWTRPRPNLTKTKHPAKQIGPSRFSSQP